MDELAHAHAELVQLQSTERMFVEQLPAIRVAVETQSREMSELVNARPLRSVVFL